MDGWTHRSALRAFGVDLRRCAGRSEHDPRLGDTRAGAPAQCPHRTVEIVGVAARDAELIVEPAGDERDLAHRADLTSGRLERLGRGCRQETHVDERVEPAPDGAPVDVRAVAVDDAGLLEPSDAIRDGVWAECHHTTQLGERRPSVSDEVAEDRAVDRVDRHRSRRVRGSDRVVLMLQASSRDVTRIGVPTEIKTDEYRVALTPAGVRELVEHGHEVVVQAGAGEGSAISDEGYRSQGARIVPDAEAVFGEGEMIVKVKEPQPDEVGRLEARHLLFTYLHLAPDAELTRGLVGSGATCVAYETVEDSRGRLPLLAPMSEVAGKIATQAGAFMLEKPLGGRGILLGGVPGVAAAKVMIIGGGVVGMNAAFIAMGMEASVYVFDRNIDRLRELDIAFGGRADTCYASTLDIEERLPEADLVIGAVLVHGARAPYVVRRDQLRLMKRNAVLVDVSIDQGGCFETSRPTTHSDLTYEVDGVTHYCVANMPGAVPITSTYALTNATLPFVLHLADAGPARAAEENPGLAKGFNVVAGKVTYRPVAEATGQAYVELGEALAAAV